MDIHKSPVVSEPKRPFQENWMCPVCTYYNLPVIDKCDMCDTVRPGGDNPSQVLSMECKWCTSQISVFEVICSTCGKSQDKESPVASESTTTTETFLEKLYEDKTLVREKPRHETEPKEKVMEPTKSPVIERLPLNPESARKEALKIDDHEDLELLVDLFEVKETVEEKKPAIKIEVPPTASTMEELLIGEDFFTEEKTAEKKKPVLLVSKEEPYEGFGISDMFEVSESKAKPKSKKAPTVMKKEVPKAEKGLDEIYLICDKCSFRNDISNLKCYACGHNLLDRIEPEPMKYEPVLASSGVCKMCSYENPPDAKQCQMCTYNLTSAKMLLSCPHCTMENHVTSTHCVMCEKELPETGYNKKLFEECTICHGILDISLFEAHVKDCKENQRLLQEMKDQEESLTLQEHCPYCNEPFFRLDFEDHIRKCERHEDYYKQAPIFGALTPTQISTMKFMHENSHKQHFSAKLPLQRRLEKMGYKLADMEVLYEYIYRRVPLIVHIHINKHMQFFVQDTHYRNQFETGKSSGCTNLVSRKSWETRMFMNRYDQSPHFERVKYGTVNFTNDPRGVNSCRSYGNSYLVLKPSVRDRCTLTDQDSSNNASLIGTFKFCYHVLNKLTDAELKATIRASRGEEVCSSVVGTYKEIQIHGPLDFAMDFEKLYVNEMEHNTPELKALVQQFTKKFGVPFQTFK